MKLTKFPIQLNNYIEEDELIYGNELIKRYILFFIPFFCISILEDCILNNLIFLLFYIFYFFFFMFVFFFFFSFFFFQAEDGIRDRVM